MRTSAAIILAACALLQGCIYAGGRTVRDVGPKITRESVAFIDLGKTTVDWVVAAFGEPNNRVCTSDGAEVLRYDSDIRTTEGSYVFLLIATSDNRIERSSWWFEVRNQKVMRVWCDKCSPADIAALTHGSGKAAMGASAEAAPDAAAETPRDSMTQNSPLPANASVE